MVEYAAIVHPKYVHDVIVFPDARRRGLRYAVCAMVLPIKLLVASKLLKRYALHF